MKMTTEEAFVKTLQMHGIEHAFGIIGSAFMPISDLFPKAGISFWDCAHEGSGGMMADSILLRVSKSNKHFLSGFRPTATSSSSKSNSPCLIIHW